MGDWIFMFFFIHTLLFALIFWGLTIFGEYFFTKKVTLTKKQFYECGFRIINDIGAHLNYNFLIFAVFLIIYDVEFIFIIPLIFNLIYIGPIVFLTVLIFFLFFLFSFIYDFQTKALNWQI